MRLSALLLSALLLVAEPAASLTDEEENTIRAIERVAPSVVFIATISITESHLLDPPRQGVGSGFVISEDGLILTNTHVVAAAEQIRLIFRDGTMAKARLVGLDQQTDIAVIRADAPREKLRPAPLGDSDAIRVGQMAIAIGNPFGLGQTASVGAITGKGRVLPISRTTLLSNVIQTDAAINLGNSGGPLVDSRGEVIGINTAIVVGANNVAFSIPINTAKDLVPQLVARGRIARPYLGVTGKVLPSQFLDLFRLPLTRGFLVEDVEKGSPAEAAGIKEGTLEVAVERERYILGGDIITEIEGIPIRSPEDYLKAISPLKVGQEITLTLFREGQNRTLRVTLAERPDRR